MEEENSMPEIYTDALRFTVSPFGVAFTFGMSVAHPTPGRVAPAKDSLILRMSLEQAKVLAMLLRRELKNYENNNNLEIALPSQLYTNLGIVKADWD